MKFRRPTLVVSAVALATILTILIFVYLPWTTLDRPRWSTAAAIGSTLVSIVAFVLAYLALDRYDRQLRREELDNVGAQASELSSAFGPIASPILRLHGLAGLYIHALDRLEPHLHDESQKWSPTEKEVGLSASLVQTCEQLDACLDRITASALVQDYVEWITTSVPDALAAQAATMIDRALAHHEVPPTHEMSRRLGGGHSIGTQLANLRREMLVETADLRTGGSWSLRGTILSLGAWMGGASRDISEIIRELQKTGIDTGSSNTFLMGSLLGTVQFPSYDYIVNLGFLNVLLISMWPTEERVSAYLLAERGFEGPLPPTVPLGGLEFAFGSMLTKEVLVLLDHPHTLIYRLPDHLREKDSALPT